MIYIICRNPSEIKYDVPPSMRIVVNNSSLYLGEIGAWDYIFQDVVNNDYKTVGIYQARRGFHKDLKLCTDSDFEVDDNSIYCTLYKLGQDTIAKQYKLCHKEYADLLEQVVTEPYRALLGINFIYPHSMFYCTQKTFYRIYGFINSMKTCPAILEYVHDKNKIFSLLTERLLTLWILKNNMNVKLCTAFALNKETGELTNSYNGISK